MHPTRPLVVVLLAMAAVWVSAVPVGAAGRGEPGRVVPIRVELVDRDVDLGAFRRMDLDVDGAFEGWARVYALPEEIAKLRAMGYRVTELAVEPVPPPSKATRTPETGIPAAYHDYTSLTAELHALAAAHPERARLVSIGTSVQGRELWVMKITGDPDLQQDEPEVAYVGGIHGDEVVGKELCIELIHYLLERYGTDPRVTDLVDGTEIWILPSMNPDGTELVQRYNANGFDLNRSFPDWFFDPVNTTAGREPETRAIMQWAESETLNLSAVFHGGALVANYPFDNNPQGASVFSPTPDPDHPAFLSIATTYAENNPTMAASPSFPGGVTNGAEWYAVTGGLQDWAYTWYGNWNVTMELGNSKWPPASQLPDDWQDNRESMLAYFERVHDGVRGIVTDAATGAPVRAAILLDAGPFPVPTDPDVGDYHRIVLRGSYTLQVDAPGYHPALAQVLVAAGPAVRRDFALVPLPAELDAVAFRVDDGVAGNGWLDPGESADLAVTLRNAGQTVSDVDGRLLPTGWYGNVVRADATYPTIPNQGAAESDAPHHGIALAPSVPQGHQVGFAVEWGAAEASGVTEPFFLRVGEPACASASATDVPQSILDFQTTTSEIVMPAGPLVSEVRVTVDIAHTYIGDLKLTLRSPAGTPIVLHDQGGGSTNDIQGTYGVDLAAAESFAALNGEPSAGRWTLEIRDTATGDNGTLNAWSLEVCGWPEEQTTPEMRLRDVDLIGDTVRLRWWSYPGVESYRVYRSDNPGSAPAFVDVTAQDPDPTDTVFDDATGTSPAFYLVTGVGPQGEGPDGHFDP